MQRSQALISGLFLAVALAAGPACSSRAGSAGLANAPGGTRPWGPEDRSHDAVANGPGSCPEAGQQDPLPNRIPPCAEASAKPPPKPAASTQRRL